MPFYSQCSQDQILERYVFKGFQNGVFVDVGAHDGVSLNNTLFFEETHNWSGINIEPIQSVYAKLVVARPRSINLHCAVCNQDGTAEFIQNTGATEMLSGLVDHYDLRHIRRVQGENNQNGGKTELITVETKRLETILDQHNIQHIHYLSIDVEGAEMDVIQSIHFDKVFIDVIGFENNYQDVSVPIVEYLQSKGYVMFHKSLDIFMIHPKSMFYSNIQSLLFG
jgi:FkbM family methyltransferase